MTKPPDPKLHLLVVDDDVDLLEPLLEVCERFGFSVSGASDGERALEILKASEVDAVLTDVRMQPMGGFALVEKARELYPHLPFILWTGFWDRPDDARAAKIANLEKLEKPFTFQELERVLDRVKAKIVVKRPKEKMAASESQDLPSTESPD